MAGSPPPSTRGMLPHFGEGPYPCLRVTRPCEGHEGEDEMALIVLVLLILLIATGALFAVLKIALAVALGVFLALIAVGTYVAWRVRRAFRRALETPQSRTRPVVQ